ncbi:MAG: hypothetical protein RIF33_22905 [Cyclobacteriaceae bacterium]
MNNKIIDAFAILLLVFLNYFSVYSQSEIRVKEPGIVVSDNQTEAPDSSAVFDVSSNTKGVVFPRLTTLERDAIPNPVAGLLIFNQDLLVYQYWNGSSWITFGGIIDYNPSSPSSLAASPDDIDIAINLSWNNTDSTSDIEIYKKLASNAEFNLLNTLSPQSAEYADQNVLANVEYCYKIKYSNQTLFSQDTCVYAPVTPKILGNNLVAWWRSDEWEDSGGNTINHTGLVQRLFDLSGNGRDLVQNDHNSRPHHSVVQPVANANINQNRAIYYYRTGTNTRRHIRIDPQDWALQKAYL